MEVPRLGVKSELQLPAYSTATATQDPSHVCNIHHSSQQCQTLTQWAGPGIKPISSWIVVRFVTSEHVSEDYSWPILQGTWGKQQSVLKGLGDRILACAKNYMSRMSLAFYVSKFPTTNANLELLSCSGLLLFSPSASAAQKWGHEKNIRFVIHSKSS